MVPSLPGKNRAYAAEGFLADIVFLDLDEINYVPLNDPLTQLVSSENGSAVASVMIGGRMVLPRWQQGRLDTLTIGVRAVGCLVLRTDVSNDPKLGRDHLELLGHVFAKPLSRVTVRALLLRFGEIDDDLFAFDILGQGATAVSL